MDCDNGGSSEQLLSKRARQRAAALKKKPEEKKGLDKSTLGAASSAADTTGRGQPAGGKQFAPQSGRCQCGLAQEGRWEVERVGSRRVHNFNNSYFGS
jgi:hypothetical protein